MDRWPEALLRFPHWASAGGEVLLVNADCRDVLPMLEKGSVDLVLTDPPYGIAYRNGGGPFGEGSIANDQDTTVRDWVVSWLDGLPALVFGSWKRPKPDGTRACLYWDGGSWGMGDLSLPWKPSVQEIYVIGKGFHGRRGTPILPFSARRAGVCTPERTHPMEKPVELLVHLLGKSPQGCVCDPFSGSGTTPVACVQTDRRCLAIELDAGYYRVGVERVKKALADTATFFGKPVQLTLAEER